MNKALNILVTGCGGDIGQSIGKILVKSDYTKNLYGIDISEKMQHSSFIQISLWVYLSRTQNI